MTATETISPPVVAAMVVHGPEAWFDDVLDALIAQDYPNLRLLFLVNGDSEEAVERIQQRIADAVIHRVDGDPGFGASANVVLDLVEGDNGFFCFLHDDVALERSTIRLLVEELYRSNAGAVGPKLVDWDDHRALQSIGWGVDAYGEIDTQLETGEADQEQHDAVRDVFALPSACLLIRADLFRALGGFSPHIHLHGEDVELCWRANLGGARLVVTPAARARHRQRLAERRPDLDHPSIAARNRVFTMATLTGRTRLPLVILRHLALTVGQLVVGLFTGTAGRAMAALRASFGLLGRGRSVWRRRAAVRAFRRVPNSEVASLQERGSARIAGYLRNRGAIPVDPESTVERRWRQTAGSAPAVFWIGMLAALVVGSRQLIAGGVPHLGQFLPFPDSPGELLDEYRSGWWSHGLGSAQPAPAGLAMVAVGSVTTLFHMGLWHTACVIGLLLVGLLGMWRLARLFPTARSRIVAVAVYAALPLPVASIASGRWAVLCCWAAMPLVVHLLRRCAGLDTAGAAHDDVVERYVVHERRRQIRLFATLVLATAVPGAFTPAFLPVVVLTGATLALAGWGVGSSPRAAVSMVAHAGAAALGAAILLLPWSSTWFGDGGWTAITGVPPDGAGGLGLVRLARFGIGTATLGALALAMYVPVVVGLLVARSWRFTWAARAAALVAVFLTLAVVGDRGSLGFHSPEPGIFLVPVAVGLALAAACLTAALQDDVLVGGFGWRQPVGVLGTAALMVGLVPGLVNVAGGRWNAPRSSQLSVVDQLPSSRQGDYRVLWLGDPRLMPVGAWMYQPGIAYALTDDGPMTITNGWAGTPTAAERSIREALDAIANGTTFRGGRLLAPYGVRYVVVPVDDGATSAAERPALATGLVDAIGDQLDLVRPALGPLSYLVYQNSAWSPTRSQLSSAAAAASKTSGLAQLASVDFAGGTPFAIGAAPRGPASGPVTGGVLHVASPLNEDWELRVGSATLSPRPAFGTTSAFDVRAGGVATLRYRTPVTRSLLVILQLLLWAITLFAATRLDPLAWYRRRRGAMAVAPGEPVQELALDDEQHAMPPWHSGIPLDDVWGDS